MPDLKIWMICSLTHKKQNSVHISLKCSNKGCLVSTLSPNCIRTRQNVSSCVGHWNIFGHVWWHSKGFEKSSEFSRKFFGNSAFDLVKFGRYKRWILLMASMDHD